jgi:hypothetical protein
VISTFPNQIAAEDAAHAPAQLSRGTDPRADHPTRERRSRARRPSSCTTSPATRRGHSWTSPGPATTTSVPETSGLLILKRDERGDTPCTPPLELGDDHGPIIGREQLPNRLGPIGRDGMLGPRNRPQGKDCVNVFHPRGSDPDGAFAQAVMMPAARLAPAARAPATLPPSAPA